MARNSLTLTILFLIVARCAASGEIANSFLRTLEDNLETKLTEYTVNVTKWLESFNDKYLGNSELGKFLHYKDIKPKIEEFTGRQGRSIKKMSMGMLPLIFHVGATSTWMILTTIMAAKSVAIGIILLVFKIAVSSAKVASFFTALKSKHSDHQHHGWSWAPHYEHHGHERSLSSIESHVATPEIHSYHPDWAMGGHTKEYHTIPTVHDYAVHEGPPPEITYAGDIKYS